MDHGDRTCTRITSAKAKDRRLVKIIFMLLTSMSFLKVRVVEYGADKYGFQPSGEGITVAPPTLVDESRLQDEEEEEQRRPQQQPTYVRTCLTLVNL